MRLPNGYGNISKLPGARRNPWRARKTAGWVIDPESKRSKQTYVTIGYYPSKQAALQALAAYNENPYDIDARNVTFAELYEKWCEKKFEKIAESNIKGYKASYVVCEPLHDMKFGDIKLSHLQGVIDQSDKNPPTLKKVKVLMNQLFDFAVANDVIPKDKHIVDYVEIRAGEQSDKHYRFTNDEVEALWRWSDNNEYVQLILMLIYSGVRPGELFNVKATSVDIDGHYFTIQKGKNDNAVRKVPIHDRTYPFFKHWLSKGNEYLITNRSGRRIDFATQHRTFCNSYWIPVLKEIGIYNYKKENGEIGEHTPDDTRHTFTTMWKEKKLDEAMRRKIQGHSGKGIGEIVYTHYDLQILREELNKL